MQLIDIQTLRRTQPQSSSRAVPLWVLHTAMVVLLLGPLISPLFRATGLPFVSDAGLLARNLLSMYICPTPAKSYFMLGLPMAVCARCWGGTIGLWLARAFFTSKFPTGVATNAVQQSQQFSALRALLTLAWPWRLCACALPFMLWPLEIAGEAQGWWYAPLWMLLLNGIQAGFAAGFFFCSIWPGLCLRTRIAQELLLVEPSR